LKNIIVRPNGDRGSVGIYLVSGARRVIGCELGVNRRANGERGASSLPGPTRAAHQGPQHQSGAGSARTNYVCHSAIHTRVRIPAHQGPRWPAAAPGMSSCPNTM